MTKKFKPISGMDLPRFAGVPTFMRLPHLNLDDPDIEKESILKMKEERYACYVENDNAAAAIGEILMIIMTIIMAAVLLRSFT